MNNTTRNTSIEREREREREREIGKEEERNMLKRELKISLFVKK